MALQIKKFSVKSSNGYTVALTLAEESTDVAGNTSKVTYTLTLSASSYSFAQYRVGASIAFDGTTIATRDRASTEQLSLSAGQSVTLLSGSCEVAHTTDGSKTVSVQYGIDMVQASYTPGTLTGTGAMALTTIASASTVTATSGYIGEAIVISVDKKNSNFKHSIAYKFGSQQGYIKSSGATATSESIFNGTTISFVIPESWYDEIPDAKTGSCALTLTTYSGGDQIGEQATAKFTVRTDSGVCAPSVSGSVADINDDTIALTGDSSVLVRYFSTARCKITASAKNGASISSKTINGTSVDGSTLDIDGIDTESISFKTTDSRGYSSTKKVTCGFVPYIKLTNNSTCQRDDPTSGNATIQVAGKYFDGSFGAVDNSLTVTYQVDGGNWTAISGVQIADGAYSAAVAISGLDYQSSHTVKVRAKDALRQVTKTITVNKGIPIFDWGESDFRFNVPVFLGDGVYALGSGESNLRVWAGSVTMTPATAGDPVSASVTFDSGLFTSAPFVLVTPVTQQPGNVHASAYNATAKGADIYLVREDTLETSVRILAIGT